MLVLFTLFINYNAMMIYLFIQYDFSFVVLLSLEIQYINMLSQSVVCVVFNCCQSLLKFDMVLLYLLACSFITLEPSTMVLSITGTSTLKPPKKRPFENQVHHQYQSFPPNFKRPKVDAIRDWPRLCGNFTPPTDSNVIGDNIAFGTAGNLQAPVANGIQSSKLRSTIDAEVTRDKVPRSYPPRKVLKKYPVVRDFPAGFKSASSSTNNISASEKFNAEHRPLKIIATCPKSLGREMQGGSNYNVALERSSYKESNGVQSKIGGEVGETSGAMGKWVDDAKHACIFLVPEIRVGDSFRSALESSTCKETGNESQNNFGGDAGERYKAEVKCSVDAKEIYTSLGQGKGGGNCNRALERSPWEATINEFWDKFGGVGGTSGLVIRQDGDAKEIGMHPQVERNLLQLDPWCQTVGNKADQGKTVLRSTGKEVEICSKGQSSMDHQTIVNKSRVQQALNLFQKLLEKLTHEASLTVKRSIPGKLPVEAAMTLKRQQKWVNTTKRLGHVPGIEVGDTFHYRVELCIIGLHSHYQNGIDYMEKDGKILAISIVDSGRYANDKESSGILIYSGQGGNPMVGHKQAEDQKLERGNLALKNSMDAKTPVRVTQGFQATKVTSQGYTYNGLYFVDKYWQERGQFGTLIFKFQLKRIIGQPKCHLIELNESKKSKVCWKTTLNDISHGRVLNKFKKSKVQMKIILNDISQGKEERSIRVVNTIDDEKPQPFSYIPRMVYLESSNLSIPSGCDCTSGCSDSVKCACVLKNGGEIPFNCNGAIIEAKPWIYECGPLCKCPPSCNNRVSQSGIRFPLEVFKAKSTGWGVRSRNYIPSGSFICEYAGVLIQDKEAEHRAGNDEYLFDLGDGMNCLESQLNSFETMGDLQSSSSKAKDYGTFAIGAAKFANVGRFINHSCSPNLYAQNVLYDHDDKRMPHIMLFATKNIPPMRELTYDYNYMVGQVRDMNGKIKKKRCYCGSRECMGRMY